MRRALFFLNLGAPVLVGPLSAAAQPAGRVVLAQGIDPTTLDPPNHQEAPAANVLLKIYDTLLFSRAWKPPRRAPTGDAGIQGDAGSRGL